MIYFQNEIQHLAHEVCLYLGNIIQKVTGNTFMEFKFCSLLELNLLMGWQTRQDLINMWLNLVLRMGSK